MSSDEREQRILKLDKIKELGFLPYPRADFKPDISAYELYNTFKDLDHETVTSSSKNYSLAGRISLIRDFGKGAFITFDDTTHKFQAFISKKDISELEFKLYKLLDIGDFIGISGSVFKTKTADLAIHTKKLTILSKALRALPEKFHGLTDIEARYRKRYLDLIVNDAAKNVFIKRSKIISFLRAYFTKLDFIEVETPMMQDKAGGAIAKPFITHHNALNIDLFLRIAPELYLKRLVVGGMHKVFEINRNFRNEGISSFHNPEFTMMELYLAFATYEDLIELIETCITELCVYLHGTDSFTYNNQSISLKRPWKKLSVKESIIETLNIDANILDNASSLINYIKTKPYKDELKNHFSYGDSLMLIFDNEVEHKLVQPTFITHYPIEVSPLARKFDNDINFTERFELFICGKELANAFTELNDPIDQKQRFEAQMQQKEHNEEAHVIDEDYIQALEQGMPPTGGLGIGIDRLVMFLTDSQSIKDVILFPQLKNKL